VALEEASLHSSADAILSSNPTIYSTWYSMNIEENKILSTPQQVYWTDEDGSRHLIGILKYQSDDSIRFQGDGFELNAKGTLPWFLMHLRPEGFLGRIYAKHMHDRFGFEKNPDAWHGREIFCSSLYMTHPLGAVTVGDMSADSECRSILASPDRATENESYLDFLDSSSFDVVRTFPLGSSAGGEQPKFLATLQEKNNPSECIVKFSPPLGTPFGDRWHDLLIAEYVALESLGEYGYASAQSYIETTIERSYLVCKRFDWLPNEGKRHFISVGAIHRGLVEKPWSHWVATCEELRSHNRVSNETVMQVQDIFDYGRLIGNTDMHAGNLSFYISPDSLNRGIFTLAPVYDMLPMCWQPTPYLRDMPDYTAFDPDAQSIENHQAVSMAVTFWERLSLRDDVSHGMKLASQEMLKRINEANKAVFYVRPKI